jgi:hypothetical protein
MPLAHACTHPYMPFATSCMPMRAQLHAPACPTSGVHALARLWHARMPLRASRIDPHAETHLAGPREPVG